jgi:HEAT repeat protein
MKRLLLLVAAAVAGCAGGPSREEARQALYDQLDKDFALLNSALDQRDEDAEENISLRITKMSTARYEWLATDAVTDTNDDRRNLAVWALAFARQPEAAQVLAKALKDPHPIVRSSAAFGIGRQHPPDPPFDELFAMVEDGRPRVREAALFALKTLLEPGNDHGKLPRIIRLLDDSNVPVRNEAVQVLGRLRMKPAVPVLLKKGCNDTSFLVRLNAAMALGFYGKDVAEEATPYLIELLKDGETSVVGAAWWALKEVTGRDFDRMYGVWRDWYDEEQRKWQYVCTDHPAVIKETAGACPDCGKPLTKQAKPTKPRIEQWTCPNHPELIAPSPGKCGNCKSELVPKK